ncbi:PAS domain-containing protein [uncultured Desulfosarcina sp.]|uniref:PAS domain-containing protein n=1 Tax=uncultured Desulfosarcina sp. TaxID=218289 RepID=UPI0029C7D29A|nr:PAS domain-containing protein [uncultured Desulfosarcina sp.]
MSHEIYKSLFENSYSTMLLIHPETGKIIDANKAACRYYGYPKNELLDRTIQDINTLSREQVFTEMQKAKTERRNHFSFLHRLANGDIRDVEVFSGPIIIGQEKLLYSIIHDVTERKRMEKQVALERQFSESLINSLPGVMYVFDQFGHFKRWNSNFEAVTGYSPDQIKTMSPLDFIVSEDKDRVRKTIESVFETGNADVEAGFSTISGKTIPYLFTGYKFNQNDLKYLVGVGLDISDRVKVEKEKENLIAKLQEALSQVRQLSGFLPICASCKKIRDDKGYWNQIESYIEDHSEAEFSHSICPNCAKKLYPDLFEDDFDTRENE